MAAIGQERTGSKGIDANIMRFGPNTYLVEEIANYARNGDLFVSPFRGDANTVFIERDFVKALERARTQEPEADDAIWTDLNELMMSSVRAQGYRSFGFDLISKELPKLGDEFGAILKRRLGRGPYDEIIDELASDLYHVAYKRAVLGNESHFFETLYKCYLDGGWPCGWKGEHPAGRLLVYSPKVDAT